MSTWAKAHQPMVCSSNGCTVTIAAGEVYREITAGRWPVCAACCLRRFGVAAPAEMPAPAISSPSGRLLPFRGTADLVRDYKAAQMAPDKDEVEP